MTEILSNVSEVATVILAVASDIVGFIVSEPLLLMGAVVGLISFGFITVKGLIFGR